MFQGLEKPHVSVSLFVRSKDKTWVVKNLTLQTMEGSDPSKRKESVHLTRGQPG